MRIFFISIFLLTHQTIKDKKLIVEENVARFHRQHLVNATFLRDGYAATLEYFSAQPNTCSLVTLDQPDVL